jgi:hypothetical protein
MCDESIRRVCIADQAQAAARRFVETGQCEPNPHAGTPDEPVFKAAFDRYLHLLTGAEAEGGA